MHRYRRLSPCQSQLPQPAFSITGIHPTPRCLRALLHAHLQLPSIITKALATSLLDPQKYPESYKLQSTQCFKNIFIVIIILRKFAVSKLQRYKKNGNLKKIQIFFIYTCMHIHIYSLYRYNHIRQKISNILLNRKIQ